MWYDMGRGCRHIHEASVFTGDEAIDNKACLS